MSSEDPAVPQIGEKARRQQILEAAGRAFARKGFHGTTVKDIAAEAGLAPGTLYLHFENKHDILAGIFDQVIDIAEVKVSDLAELPLEEALAAFVEDRLEVLTQARDVVKVVIGESVFDEELAQRIGDSILGRTAQLVRKLLTAHGLADLPEAQLELAARCLQAQVLYWGVWLPTLQPARVRKPRELSAQIARLVVGGLTGLQEGAAAACPTQQPSPPGAECLALSLWWPF